MLIPSPWLGLWQYQGAVFASAKQTRKKRIMAVPIVRAPGTRVPSLRFGIGKLLSFALLVFSIQSTAYAWLAKDSITGQLIEVMSPPRPDMIGKDGNSEIQYRFKGEAQMHVGEVTTWLSKCIDKYCRTSHSRTFELNTFSEHGLMYLFPLDE